MNATLDDNHTKMDSYQKKAEANMAKFEKEKKKKGRDYVTSN
jgi:hypothetical protein